MFIWPIAGALLVAAVLLRAPEPAPGHAAPPAATTQTALPPKHAGEPIPATTAVDDLRRARVGACFQDLSTGPSHDFTLADCADGTYELLRRLPASAESEACWADDRANWLLRSGDSTLCLRYRYPNGTGNLAVGSCVIPTAAGDAIPGRCKPGGFTVSAKHYGTTNGDKCGKDIPSIHTHPTRSELSVVLCLRPIPA
ncbi:hypothetical protein [Actinokineospora globicatena]|uniref:hypothetical protein n=1 Tax=Actinokineospora globicatena TaxID=103729 RepID=UPI0020A34B46|nr:hypothetical protein [Actinokineospora globicatena]GLW76471.1 hypothetical protein Aglo01_09530 [Actinokineospora globicatena]GLW83306.1 hypothetical protein Aglo02_09460 [Actinokineospora globicatena]